MSRIPSDDEIAGTLVTACDLDAPPSTVWRALTTPEIVREWLGASDIRPEPGRPFGLDLPPERGGRIAGEVIEAVPFERLSMTWRSAEPDGADRAPDSRVTFELTPLREGGTHLRILHTVASAAVAAPRRVPARSLAQLRPGRRRPPAAMRPSLTLRRAA
ncbi:SRPBCC family protein [Salinarimonas soli]|uniref:SRPBCC domain-containing protein n=1 Tax=Salinarimonas soli TaxID=1638099 RepID=A0A5B2VEK9_9HYPH|nr:SRPBCC domain-containing protein [Salinarimonas soli]KAA2236617.1 SRPBCC domain-containing protein [Salinarimonas soli]